MSKHEEPLPYGARCTWWDSMDKVGTLPTEPMELTRGDGSKTTIGGYPIPCCPICHGVLFQVASLEEWNQNVARFSLEKRDPGYVAFIDWLRGRCFPDFKKARFAYDNREQFAEDIGKGPFAGTMTQFRREMGG